MSKEEEPYSDDIIILIDKWKADCIEKSETHSELGKRYNNKYLWYGIIPLILPLFMTFTSQTIEDSEVNKIVSGVGFMVIGVCNAVLKFLDLKTQSIENDFASFQYNNIINFIEANASRQEAHRLPADVVLATIRTELKNLENYSPNTNFDCFCNSCKK